MALSWSEVSRSLMGSSNCRCEVARHGLRTSRDPSWGVRTYALMRRRTARRALAIPHGEFEPAIWRRGSRPMQRSRSLMGSSNRRRDAALLVRQWRSRDPSWGVRTERCRDQSIARMAARDPSWGVRTRRCLHRRASSRRSRDPSWGVRTRPALSDAHRRDSLAIPHGEFEPCTCETVAIALAIPHGEFEPVSERARPIGLLSRSLMGSSNRLHNSRLLRFSIFETFRFMTVRLHFCYATPHFQRERWA